MSILGNYIFLSVAQYLTSLLCFILAFLVFHANPKSKSCRLTTLFNASISFWSFWYATHLLITDHALSILATTLIAVGTVLLSTFLTHLTLIEVKLENKKRKFLLINYLFSAGLLLALAVKPTAFVYGAIPKLDLPAYTEAGPLYVIIPLQLFFNLVYSCYELYRGIHRSKGFRKNQLRLLLVALIVGYAAGTPAYLLVFNIPVKPYTAPLVSLFPIIITFAIIRHRFLDIQKLVKNTLIFSLLFFFLLGSVSVILLFLKEGLSQWVGIPETVAQGIAIALALALYGPLKKGLSHFTHRMLYQQSQDPKIIFNRLSQDMLHYLDSQSIANEITRRIAEILVLDRIAFYARPKKAPYFFELQAAIGKFRKKQMHRSKQLIYYLEKTHDLLINSQNQVEARLGSRHETNFALSSLKEIKKIATYELAALGGIAAFPIIVKDQVRAILIVGKKMSDAPWRDEEFQILRSFSQHLGLALANADYAEGIRHSRRKLARNERDALAGVLIAGIDHEVKNPLHTMALTLGSLREGMKRKDFSDEKFSKSVSQTMNYVLEDIATIHGIIEHLSNLADKKPLQIESAMKPAVIAKKVIQELTQGASSHGIEIQLNVPEDLTLASDSNALYEILTNLLKNGIQAIPEKGKITIEASQKNGDTILRIQDSGIGIPQERLTKIFDPFFTTKQDTQRDGSKGSGMGLFIVKEYMQALGGFVEVHSEPNKGTLFQLHFPKWEPLLEEAA